MKTQHATTPKDSSRVLPEDTSETFWERVYAGKSEPSSGRPSEVLTRFVADRRPAHALELGCARGDDAIWLARHGWNVTGVDVSEHALAAAREAARAAGVEGHTQFVRHDLGETFPAGTFDLVTAMFFQSPIPFARSQALRRASLAVASGGMLLIAAHGSRPPWSWADPDTVFPAADEELAGLALRSGEWRKLFVGAIPRIATGPGGQTAELLDTVVALERR